ncbi:sugar-binding domain-containing protein [Companilactobacillus kimchii]|uniref:Beta-galactosidase n=2 Tax=Companilactobacillus kimchii TaxID=2801452 RepID=A0ABR5NT00_9LACO|nr:sugar-binding domain-containing protein [Companilactobacillus kimchii]KAE9562158.1 glycoside hydrolase [Companilactobacillus kimchii]KRK51221.1 hypothetical protein FC97_GL000912 [Companilactobacillus kimchii DSM 13961 = JCM 10707]OWF34296.1 Beta-galactosidase [Companilactobacillus kimchii]GEO46217.1 beta-galactosidase [Companilactobacillus paralimentarius]
MTKKEILNNNWLFHYGELERQPLKTTKKAASLGGLTAPLANEVGNRLPISAGGTHFLKLIAQGDEEQGLLNLAGTDLTDKLADEWENTDLPHDWNRKVPYVNNPEKLMSGSKPDAVGYYRKTFKLSDSELNKTKTILHFDGVMRMADIWLNGMYLGHNNSGYNSFSFDITEMARYGAEGENVVLVRADTTTGAEGWWYEGAGIYRSVWLEYKPLISIDSDDCYIYTKSLSNNKAVLGIELSVKNDTNELQVVAPKVSLDGKKIIQFDETEIDGHQCHNFEKTITLMQPKLWTPETPYCYEAEFEIDTDKILKNFGIHTFAYTTDGFFLNGQSYQLHGICEHQDFAGVGTALNQDIVDYKVKVMKGMGANAWRSTHHFASEELLNACDRFGIILINENRLLESTPWRVNDLKQMVLKDRMHPSIGFWSISNEELIGNTPLGSRIAQKLTQTIKQYDHEHLIIGAELLTPEGIIDENYVKNLDVLGVNYPEAGVMGSGAKLIHKKYPKLPMMSTENASYFSTRGIYKDNEDKRQCNNFGSYFSMVLPGVRKPGDPGVGGTAHPETVINYLKNNPYMGGVFLWTGFDYYGEPSPFNWPAISSQFGITDLCGFPKDYYYYYQAHWTKEPMIHLMPSWNKDQLELNKQGQVSIRTFSNAEIIELFVNDHSYGKKNLDDCTANWSIPYEPGELKVVAYQKGKVVAQDSRFSNGPTKKISSSKIYEGKNMTLVALKAVDKNNKFVENANESVNLEVSNGKIIGTGNGNPIDQNMDNNKVNLFNGLALVIVSKNSDLRIHLN